MQIVIPMSGVGARFLEAGYLVPKPLIEVDGKPIIQYVVEMFQGETDFLFICNQEHLAIPEFRMEKILSGLAPEGRIVGIAPHKKGPVHAVLQAEEYIQIDRPFIINYCDFTCDWNYRQLKSYLNKEKPDGCIPCYRGFHPHTLWNNYYAYIQEEDLVGIDVQEKKPFTTDPRNEFASSGTYYFKSFTLFKEYTKKMIEARLDVASEYYVSMVYKPMMEEDKKVLVYELEHFMQWGVPADLEEYLYWSGAFRKLLEERSQARQPGTIIMPMAGWGSRFTQEGYHTPKPLIEVSGRPMAANALCDLPKADQNVFVLRKNLKGRGKLQKILARAVSKPSFVILDQMTDGQATTCVEGVKKIPNDTCITIAACDNGMIYDVEKFEKLLKNTDWDVIVWGTIGYPGAIRLPAMYGWIDWNSSTGAIKGVSVKKPLSNPKTDPSIVGTFTFKKAEDFVACVNRMKSRDGRVNGEFYIDNAINDALALGLSCVVFLIDYYLCWGTPNDLRAFNYWQSCFDKWDQHPYSLEQDSYIAQNFYGL